MTPAEVTTVLSYFTAAWPWIEVGDDTPLVWADHLSGVDAQDAHTAAKRCVQQLDRPPSVAEFLRHTRAVTASHRPALPAPNREVLPTARSARVAGIIAAGMRAAAESVPEHRHRDGWEQCPACSTRDTRDHAGEVMAVVRDHLATGEVQ